MKKNQGFSFYIEIYFVLFNTVFISRNAYLRSPLDSILEAVFTVSPNKQYRGIVKPTTPAHTGPKVK